jgi:hypothetical protein
MSIESELRQILNEVAERMEKQSMQLRVEYLDAEALAAKKKAEYELAANALERTFNLPLKIGTEYLCPFCLGERGVQVKLRPRAQIPAAAFSDAITDMIFLSIE